MKTRAFILRLLLWPILWWGMCSEALYCSPNEQPPVPLALDLSRVSEVDIAQTVRHLQVIVRASEARAAGLENSLAAVQTSLAAAQDRTDHLQLVLDAANDRAEKAEAKAALEEKWKWRWFWTWCGTIALVAAFFVARQYFPILKAI